MGFIKRFNMFRHYRVNRRLGGSVSESVVFCLLRPFVVTYYVIITRRRRRQELRGEWDSIFGLRASPRSPVQAIDHKLFAEYLAAHPRATTEAITSAIQAGEAQGLLANLRNQI